MYNIYEKEINTFYSTGHIGEFPTPLYSPYPAELIGFFQEPRAYHSTNTYS